MCGIFERVAGTTKRSNYLIAIKLWLLTMLYHARLLNFREKVDHICVLQRH